MKSDRTHVVLIAAFIASAALTACGDEGSQLLGGDSAGEASDVACDVAVDTDCVQDARGRWRRRQSGGSTTADAGSPSTPAPVADAGAPEGPAPSPSDSGSPATPTPSGWPDATNTGVPKGTALTNSGSLTITKDGTVIDGLNVAGCIYVDASNVTIRRSKVTADCFNGIEIRDWEGRKNLLIEDVEVDGLNKTDNCISAGAYTARRVNLHGCADGAKIGDNTTIEDSFIHNLMNDNECHCDGVQTMGGNNIVLRHNNFDVVGSGAAIMLGDEFGKLGVIVIDRNRFAGGNFSLYGGWNQQTQTTPSSLTVTNNMFAGPFTYGSHVYVAPATVWSGNVDGSGKAVAR